MFSVYIGSKDPGSGPDDLIILEKGLGGWQRKDGRLENSRRQVVEVHFLLGALVLFALVWSRMSCFLGKTKEEEDGSCARKDTERLLFLCVRVG